MAENRIDAFDLAQEYMANAVRTYKETGHDPAAKSYYFRCWSLSADDAAKLRQFMGGASQSDNGELLIHRSDLDDRSIAHKIHHFEVGDVAALAAWITEQEQLGRMWTVPAWCGRAEEKAITTLDPSQADGVIADGDNFGRPVLVDGPGKEISVNMPVEAAGED